MEWNKLKFLSKYLINKCWNEELEPQQFRININDDILINGKINKLDNSTLIEISKYHDKQNFNDSIMIAKWDFNLFSESAYFKGYEIYYKNGLYVRENYFKSNNIVQNNNYNFTILSQYGYKYILLSPNSYSDDCYIGKTKKILIEKAKTLRWKVNIINIQ